MARQLKKLQNIEELLEIIEESRNSYQAQWQGLSEEEMIQHPGPQDDWSVKDQIAHIVWWEGYMMDVLTLLSAGQKVPRINDYDALNARVWVRHADLPLDYIIASFERNWERLQALLNSLSIEALLEDDGVGMGWIRADTFGHYEEHLPDLVRYTESLKA